METRKLRIGFFFPPICVSRPIDPSSIWTSPRGLTGSEIACVMYALGLARRGHSVAFFTKVSSPGKVEDVAFLPYEEWVNTYHKQHWDALCSWMVPQPLKFADPSSFRFMNQQVSELTLFEQGWESYVDLFTPLSRSHAHYMASRTPFPRDRWRILYNGVDVESFRPGEKEPGKMVWASSHDRGLHWLLEAYPRIKQAVPHASLHVFYNFEGLDYFASMEPAVERANPTYPELARRARYVKDAFRRLEGQGVHVHASVSRDRIRAEMATAEVLPYPCDPVLYTETFGVTVLEACASGTVPVLCTADAFGELWGSVGLNVPPPYADHKDQFADHVIKVLTDKPLRERLSAEAVSHARRFHWTGLVDGLEKCLLSRGSEGLPEVGWGAPGKSAAPAAAPSGDPGVKLNIGSGPNVFPFPGWINYDRVGIDGYVSALREMYLHRIPDPRQAELARYVQAGKELDVRVHDLRDGFAQHPDGSVDAIYLGQIVEHLNPLHETPKLIRECHRMLKPGGVLRITTPDLDRVVRAYVGGDMGRFAGEFPDFYRGAVPSDQLAYILYGSAGAGSTWDSYDGHMHMYTRESMARLLSEAGFEPPFSHPAPGESVSPELAAEVVDAGMGHSFITEAVRR